jgi:hypothetical protein
MKTKISTKSHYVRTDGWRGYSEPINAVGGCNCTGDWSDSPCPTYVVKDELGRFKSKLRKANIRFKQFVTRSSNLFCVKVWVLVAPEDKERAMEIAKAHVEDNTRLFYTA